MLQCKWFSISNSTAAREQHFLIFQIAFLVAFLVWLSSLKICELDGRTTPQKLGAIQGVWQGQKWWSSRCRFSCLFLMMFNDQMMVLLFKLFSSSSTYIKREEIVATQYLSRIKNSRYIITWLRFWSIILGPMWY